MLGTLHTQSASSTVDRIIDVFPPSQQEQVRMQIAGSLQGIITQALLPTADGSAAAAALEVLLPDDATRNLIRQGKVEQIHTIMQTGTQKGMQTMEQSLAELTLRRVITLEIAHSRARAARTSCSVCSNARTSTRAPRMRSPTNPGDAAARRRPTSRGGIARGRAVDLEEGDLLPQEEGRARCGTDRGTEQQPAEPSEPQQSIWKKEIFVTP